jgi:hypothetical protein
VRGARLEILFTLLLQHLLSDIYLYWFKVKELEEGRKKEWR